MVYAHFSSIATWINIYGYNDYLNWINANKYYKTPSSRYNLPQTNLIVNPKRDMSTPRAAQLSVGIVFQQIPRMRRTILKFNGLKEE